MSMRILQIGRVLGSFLVILALIMQPVFGQSKKNRKSKKKKKKAPAPCFDNDSFEGLTKLLSELDTNSAGYKRTMKEVYREEAMLLEIDKTPVDVILRRTKALLKHIQGLKDAPDVAKEAKELGVLAKRNSSSLSADAQKALFVEAKKLRRRTAF